MSQTIAAAAGRPVPAEGAGPLGPAGIAVLLTCAFLPIVDFFIVNVALPTIDAGLHTSAPTLELVVAGYGTAYAALLVLGGRLGDQFGRRRLLVAGLAGFTATSLLCGLAPGAGLLVLARVLQGATAALLVPQVLGTFQAALEGTRRTRALGLYAATAGIASVVGQAVGGLLVSADVAGSSWRPIFLINVPIGLAALAVVRPLVPNTRADRPAGVDLAGTLLFAATLAALLIALTEGRAVGWAAWVWVVLASAPVLAAATVVVERRAERNGRLPLLPPSLLALPSMRRGLLLGLPFFLGFGAFMFVFALTTQSGLHASAIESGLTLVPFGLAFFATSLAAPRLIDRFGPAVLTAGAVLQVAGLAALALTIGLGWPNVSLLDFLPGLVVIGVGQCLEITSLFRLILSDVPAHLSGVGGGVLITLQQSGLAIGVATLGTLFVSLAGSGTARVGTAFAVVVAVNAGIGVMLAGGSRFRRC